MEWKVISSCTCSFTKTTFALMKTDRNIRLIIWWDEVAKMQRGDTLRCGLSAMYINNEKIRMGILKVMPYNRSLWQRFLKSTGNNKHPVSHSRNSTINAPFAEISNILLRN